MHFQKELINAFNCCLYVVERKNNPKQTFGACIKREKIPATIDQFFIPNNVDGTPLCLAEYLGSAEFSSEAYKIACEAKVQEEPKGVFKEELLSQAISMFNELLEEASDSSESFFHILSHLWKAVYFYNHGLRIEAVIFARSVFESLVKKKIGQKNLKAKDYKFYLCENDWDLFDGFREIRNNAVHSLEPTKEVEMILQCLERLAFYFKRDSGIDISDICR